MPSAPHPGHTNLNYTREEEEHVKGTALRLGGEGRLLIGGGAVVMVRGLEAVVVEGKTVKSSGGEEGKGMENIGGDGESGIVVVMEEVVEEMEGAMIVLEEEWTGDVNVEEEMKCGTV